MLPEAQQLFDLGILFEYITDLKEISQSYKKIACLAFLIKDGRLDMDIEGLKQNRGDVERIMDVLLPEEFGILNKLKAVSPESFYLWAIATEVMPEDENDKQGDRNNKMEESQQIEFKKSLAERKEIENLSNEIHEFICIKMPTLCQLYANYL